MRTDDLDEIERAREREAAPIWLQLLVGLGLLALIAVLIVAFGT